MLFSGANDRTVKAWNYNGECVKTLTGHTTMVLSVVNLNIPNKTILASGCWNRHIKIWDVDQGICIKTMSEHTSGIQCMIKLNKIYSISNNILLASGSNDCTIKLWDVDSGICLKTLKGHNSCIRYMTVLKKNLIISGGGNNTIKIWDVIEGICVKSLDGKFDCLVRNELLSKSLICGMHHSIEIRDIENGEIKKKLDIGGMNLYYLASLGKYNGSMIAGDGGRKGVISIWDVEKGICTESFNGHLKTVLCVEVMDVIDKNLIVSGSLDETIKIWDMDEKVCVNTLVGHNGGINCVCN